MGCYLIKGGFRNVAEGLDRPGLPKPMNSIQSLGLDHRIPLRLHEMNMRRSCKVEACDNISRKLEKGSMGFLSHPTPPLPIDINRTVTRVPD